MLETLIPCPTISLARLSIDSSRISGVPNYPRFKAEEVFHAPKFSNPPMSTQKGTVNNSINLPSSPQKWSGLETLVEVRSNKVQTAETDRTSMYIRTYVACTNDVIYML